MKAFRPLFVLCLFSNVLCRITNAQSGTWVWMNGSNAPNDSGHYGMQGVASPNNTPEALYEAANWIDLQGNFWILGGVNEIDSQETETNNLWQYNPQNNLWTWMMGGGNTYANDGVYGTLGIPSPSNIPSARGWGSLTWTDHNGDLWLYGGSGVDSHGNRGYLDDLWKYNIATNEWTWINGGDTAVLQPPAYGNFQQLSASNTPGGRAECNSTWIDNYDNLWLFGGEGVGTAVYDSYNDMWRYNISSNEWAWMNGSQGTGQSGNYGTLGVESDTNLPTQRYSYTKWQDNECNFYLYGGLSDWDSELAYNDVWKYSIKTNNWTWISGDSSGNSSGIYDQYCTEWWQPGTCRQNGKQDSTNIGLAKYFPDFWWAQSENWVV